MSCTKFLSFKVSDFASVILSSGSAPLSKLVISGDLGHLEYCLHERQSRLKVGSVGSLGAQSRPILR